MSVIGNLIGYKYLSFYGVTITIENSYCEKIANWTSHLVISETYCENCYHKVIIIQSFAIENNFISLDIHTHIQ